jgi:hypothetical protein
MNRKGHQQNLEPAQPGNTNAEKSGVYSKRRRTEKALEIRQNLDRDFEGVVNDDCIERYAQLRALNELCEADIADRGVSDSLGNQRRIVGTYQRNIRILKELSDEFQAELAARAGEDRNAEPWTTAEGTGLLRDIAHNYGKSPAASVAAIKLLLERTADPEVPYNVEYYSELIAMTDEELDRELYFLRLPVTTDPGRERRPMPLKPARMIIRELASRAEITDDDLLSLCRSLSEDVGLPQHSGEVQQSSIADEPKDEDKAP